MGVVIKPKRGHYAPSSGDLETYELAMCPDTRELYTKDDNGNIITIANYSNEAKSKRIAVDIRGGQSHQVDFFVEPKQIIVYVRAFSGQFVPLVLDKTMWGVAGEIKLSAAAYNDTSNDYRGEIFKCLVSIKKDSATKYTVSLLFVGLHYASDSSYHDRNGNSNYRIEHVVANY